jgi:hypothetical protein
MKKLLAAMASGILSFGLSACGSGASSTPFDGPTSEAQADASSGSAISIEASTAELSLAGTPSPTTITFTWALRSGNGSPNYAANAYVVPAGSGASATLDVGHRMFGKTCGAAPSDCDATGRTTCTYRVGSDGPVLDCTDRRLRVDPGQYDVVVQLCTDGACRGEDGADRKVFTGVSLTE